MRRWLLFVPLLLLACQAISAISGVATLTPQPQPEATPPSLGPLQGGAPGGALQETPQNGGSLQDVEPFGSATGTPAVATPSPAPGESFGNAPVAGFTVRFHPDGSLYAGDRISIEVIAPEGFDAEGKQVQIVANSEEQGEPPQELGAARLEAFGIGRRVQATFTWAWDTTGLEAGDHELDFAVQSIPPRQDCPDREGCPGVSEPGDPAWTQTVRLLPAEDVPPPEPQARWETAETGCCIVHYITGTDAERDLSEILEIAERQAASAVQQMGIDFPDPIRITILPRVLGHGGFAADEIYISYLDRNYAGNDLAQVLHHEMIHILDGRLEGELRPSILVEGLAVYLSGGHFKEEPLLPRAAALLDLGWYLPLEELADDFYSSQHEIGYLEGAALVQYLVETYGRESFEAFYRDIHPHPSEKQSRAMDVALQAHFDLTLEEVEQRFKVELYRQPFDAGAQEDLRLSVEFFESVRRYQQALDPSAYFLTAWLPNANEMRERGIVADYLRRPAGVENLAIEALLVQADRDLRSGAYVQVEQSLERVDHRLDRVEFPVPVEAILILLLMPRRRKRQPLFLEVFRPPLGEAKPGCVRQVQLNK